MVSGLRENSSSTFATNDQDHWSADVIAAVTQNMERMLPDRARARSAYTRSDAYDAGLWAMLVELGVVGASLPTSHGGLDASLKFDLAVAECLAHAVAPVPIIPALLAARVLGHSANSPVAATLAADLISGRSAVGVTIAAPDGPSGSLTVDDMHISGDLGLVADAAALDVLIIFAEGSWWAIDAHHDGVEIVPHKSFDATRRLASVEFHRAPAQNVGELPVECAENLAMLYLAAESAAIAGAALKLASDYALVREQFGEKIGRFQAIKHKLADCQVAVENARSSVYGARSSASSGFPTRSSAQIAKIVATSAATGVALQAIQAHGAIGATWEHDLHILLRRAKTNELLLGSPDNHLEQLSRHRLAPAVSNADAMSASDGLDFDLGLLKEDKEFITEFRGWLDEALTEERRNALRTRSLPMLREWQAMLADAGWAGIHWPEAHGGRNASFAQQVLYHAEIAARRLPTLVGNRGLSLIGPTIIAHGNTEQQRRFLAPTRRAEILWASGFSEPGAGSDLASLTTRGEVKDDHIIVNGMKIWTSGATFCDLMYTLIRTGPAQPKHDGISCVVIPLDAPGVTVRPIRRLDGDVHFCEVFLDNVRIEMDNLIGPLDRGWSVSRTTLAHEHSTNFLGAQQKQLAFVDRLIDQYVASRGDRPLDPAITLRLTRAWINTQLLKLHGLRSVEGILGGGADVVDGSVLKLFGQEQERDIYELQLDMGGPDGLINQRSGKAFLAARTATIGGGTSEIHRNKIAEKVLNMPRDRWK